MRARKELGGDGVDWKADRVCRRGGRVGVVVDAEVGWPVGEERERFEALREGGPRKREGGGARKGCVDEGGERVAIPFFLSSFWG